ncbi:hypothetical protein GW916_04615 [bacterium]|nr:hypothetical protein [bacterium]
MEDLNFRDILREKIGSQKSAGNLNKETQNPLQQSLSELSPELLRLQFRAPKTSSMKAYPKASSTGAPPQKAPLDDPTLGPKKTFETRVKKDDLDQVGTAKWARFEQMVGKNFENSLSEEQVLRVFRLHMKQNHPDLAGANSIFLDFALMVKIKNELVQVLKAAKLKAKKDPFLP